MRQNVRKPLAAAKRRLDAVLVSALALATGGITAYLFTQIADGYASIARNNAELADCGTKYFCTGVFHADIAWRNSMLEMYIGMFWLGAVVFGLMFIVAAIQLVLGMRDYIHSRKRLAVAQ